MTIEHDSAIQPAKDIAGLNIYLDTLPEGARVRRLAGDFLDRGTIENMNRPPKLEILVKNGIGYHVDHDGYVEEAIVIDVDGAIEIGGGGWTFLPDAGEMERVGLVTTPPTTE